ncbi:MAG TPA: hypothetical protein VEJ23_06140, partial [Solirubrobacteraceae bacterium]|nr:hypothetical protein [Solirubrobacteraceae bacterium]
MNRLQVAVDAGDLAHDFRGIARYLRAVLAQLGARDDVLVKLVGRGPLRRVPRGTDVVWHPWNGTFLAARAPAVVTFHDAAPFRFPTADARKRRNEQGPFLRSAARGSAFLADSRFTAGEIERFLGVAAARQTV